MHIPTGQLTRSLLPVENKRSMDELKIVIESQNELIERLIREKEDLRREKDEEIAQMYRLYLSTKRELFEWISIIDPDQHQKPVP